MPLTNNQGLGTSQTWQDVTASRALSTVYTNSTGKPIQVLAQITVGTAGDVSLVIDSVLKKVVGTSGTQSTAAVSFIVPPNKTYELRTVAGTPTLTTWVELR